MNKAIFWSALLFLAACTGNQSVQVTQQVVAPPPVLPPPPVIPPAVDDTVALQALINKGGIVQLEGRAYHVTRTLTMPSDTTVQGLPGYTVIEFTPPAVGSPRSWCVNDRVFGLDCGPFHTTQLPIAAGINKGDSSFTAVNADDVADLAPGDWVIVNVNDPGIADINTHLGYPTYIDWAQVQSVVGLTVYTVQPFRMAFPGTLPFVTNDSGLGFIKTTGRHNQTIQDLTIQVDDGSEAVGVYVLGTLNTTLKNVTINDSNSDPVYTEESKGLSILQCNLVGDKIINELAESVDLTITDSHFSANAVAIGLDLGTGFFTIERNTISQSSHLALYALYHVHDGVIEGNTIEGIESTGKSSIGMLVWGSPDITITGNVVTGNGDPQSVGIQVSADPNAALPETTEGDVVDQNTVTGFATAQSVH